MSSLLTPAPFKIRPLLDRERRYWQRRRSLVIRQWRSMLGFHLTLGMLLLGGFAIAAFVTWGISWQLFVGCVVVAFVSALPLTMEGSSYIKNRQRIEQILAQGICRELRVQATQVWEYEPSKEFGACYALEQDNGPVIVVQGWEFFDEPRFPNTDFLLVRYAELDSILNAMRIVRRGATLLPSRVFEECLDLPCENEPAFCFAGDFAQFEGVMPCRVP